MKIYGPRPEEAFEKAETMTLATGCLPSDAAKQIRALVCPANPPLQGCHCHIAVSSFWRRLLPKDVRGAVANMDLQANFDQTIEAADVYFKAYQEKGLRPAQVAAIRSPQVVPATPATPAAPATNFPDLDSFAAHVTAEIAAFRGRPNNTRGRGQNNTRTQNSGTQNQGQRRVPTRKPQPHPDGPPSNACITHWNHGRQAYSCAARDTCPWRDILAPRPTRN